MRLSERGAIKSAIADGGFHLYPAGRLLDIIKEGISGDNLNGDFDPVSTVQKIAGLKGPEDGIAREIFERDVALLRDRLSKMNPEYDIESVFDRMIEAMPMLAKRYYGIDGFEAPRPKVIEYYFEGHNDLYKDGDWIAFNVNSMESKELNVPVGTYFKRNQVSPGMPEFVTMHEANHAMQEKVATTTDYHNYIPWMDEGIADILGRMMLFRATENEDLMMKVKNFFLEVEVIDPRKVTYHYGEETAALILMRGRLPFLKTLMKARKDDMFSIDWNAFANMIKGGLDPHIALVRSHIGKKLDSFKKKIERDEKSFRAEADLDQMDLRIISMFLASQAPARISPAEYKAALWIADETAKRPSPHHVDANVIDEKLRGKVAGWQADSAIPASSVPANVWEGSPALDIKILIRESDVPEAIRAGVSSLAAMYFIIKRQLGNEIYYEPYGGGLPYRLTTGEVRCNY